jgi:membrane protein
MKRTKSKKNYITRLAIFAIISQIPYILMIKGIPSTSLTETTELEKVLKVFNHFTSLFNVGFTLLLGAITIYVLEKSKKEKYGFLNITILIMLSIYISETFGFDGGFYSYFLILMFYYIPIKHKVKQIIVMSILNIIYVLYMSIHVKGNFFELVSLYSVQLYSILALPIIYFLNTDKKNKRVESAYVKLLKYSIYPVHMLIIFWIRLMFFTI